MDNFKVVIIFFSMIFGYGCSENQPQFNSVSQPIGAASQNNNLLNTDYNILFIGNSLTYYNNLPLLVQETAKLEGRDWHKIDCPW